MAGVKRARVYFDIAPFGTNPGGRLVFELYNDIVAATAENFRQLCTGEHGVGKGGTPLTYKGLLPSCNHHTFMHAACSSQECVPELACMLVRRQQLPSDHPRVHGAR